MADQLEGGLMSAPETRFLRSHDLADIQAQGLRIERRPARKPDGTVVPGLYNAWIWLDNPDGLLATDNWALPYARLRLPVPANGSRAAARALALAAGDGGRMYLEALIHAVGQPSDEEMKALAIVVRRHQTEARERGARARELEACWNALWDEVKTTVRPEVWERFKPLR